MENLQQIKEKIKFLLMISLPALVLTSLLFAIPDKWPWYTILIYIYIGAFWLTAATTVLYSSTEYLKIIKISGNEDLTAQYLKLHEEKKKIAEIKKQAEEKNIAVIGDLYAVITKDSRDATIWLTEDESGWDLQQKFGWWQYKLRKQPHPSTTHDIVRVSREVIFDSSLHKKVSNAFISDEQRKLRRIRFHQDEKNKIRDYSIYVINDRINKTINILRVHANDRDKFLNENAPSEFIKIIQACKNTKSE